MTDDDPLFLLFCARRDEESAASAAERSEDPAWYLARAAAYRADVDLLLGKRRTFCQPIPEPA